MDFHGKHYTLYAAEQEQRRIERELRKEKAGLNLYKGVRDTDPLLETEYQKTRKRISGLNNEYKELGAILKPKAIRMKKDRASIPRGSTGSAKMPAQPPLNTTVSKDSATGLKSVGFNPANYPDPVRVRELAKDAATGKNIIHEGNAATRLESILGGKLERVQIPQIGQAGQQLPKTSDFIFTNGNYAGKTVDFIWTIDGGKQSALNNAFQKTPKNIRNNYNQLIEHLNKTDIVLIDFRHLDNANQNLINSWLGLLSSEQRNKILIVR